MHRLCECVLCPITYTVTHTHTHTHTQAEDNWRNDYPDEDEWKGEEEGTSGSDDDDDDISSNQMYRQRDIPLMLNYGECCL